MRTLIIGGHGKVARKLSPMLHERGHEVTAVIRNPDHSADVESDGATALVADVESMDVDQLADMLRGNDAVVWSAGAGGGSRERTNAVDREAAIRSVDAAKAAGVDRYLMVSYFGAGPDHGVPEDNPFFAYAQAKADADAHLQGSDLSWTILGPSGLTDDAGTGSIETDRDGATAGSVSRADVAQVIADALERPGLAGTFVKFNNGGTPIAQALDALEG